MRVRRLAAAAAAVTLTAGLAACGDDAPEAGTTTGDQASDNNGSSADNGDADDDGDSGGGDADGEPGDSDESVPKMPDNVPGEDEQVTFVKHYMDVYNYAIRTGDVEPLIELSADDCDNCRGGAEWIRDIYNAGGHVENGEKDVLGDPLWLDDEDPPVVTLTYEEHDYTVVESGGDEPTEIEGCPGIQEEYELEQEGDQWQVTDLSIRDQCVD